MENSFLKRSSLALGFLLAASSIAAAETSPSSIDDPAVLQNLLSLVADKAKADAELAPGNPDALNDPRVLEKMLRVVAEKAKADAELAPGNPDALNDPRVLEKMLSMVPQKEPTEVSAFDNPAMMETILAQMAQLSSEQSYMADEVPTDPSSVLNGANIMQGILPLAGVAATPRTAEIFEPIPRTFDFSDGIPEQTMLIGMSLGQQTSAEYGDSLLFGGSIRYHLTDRLDALGNIELGLTSFGNPTIEDDDGNVDLKEHSSFRAITAGLGYSLLKGITSLDGETFLPWQLNVDGLIGEQFTGSSHGMYLGVGTSLQVMMGDYWIGTETRYYHVDDEVLNQEGSHRGLQWSIAVGFYY
ncbi:hypothetical protein Q4551_01360 [Oceanobacter sp. 5_MG-2023]|uniref:hypothetical protein n=1 Tax=Oceanobacter sp. 5_MG-2023 TaxID=3062645 RepID=UPI0026E37EFC|nr:hypothetical protein [Oceanobacter sp. 5_MG-2023]MDO6680926.1 hypothetical protein [Oceanobacter sp. 5_MG-2023]